MSAYTRKTGQKALVLRTLWGGGGGHSVHVNGLTAVPVSKVLREFPCDRCGREIERGEYVLRELPDRSVHMCATSPPFYGLRDYGTGKWEGGDPDCDHAAPATGGQTKGSSLAGTGNRGTHSADGQFRQVCGKCGALRVDRQIGLEESPDQWVSRLVEVFREVRRVLRDDGTLWVEIGDSYASGGWGDPSSSSTITGGKNRTGGSTGTRKAQVGTKPKDLLGQPWMLAKALRDPYYTGKIKSEADRVWLAAMIDAEGYIGIHKRKAGTPSYSRFDKEDGSTAEYRRKQDTYQPKLEISNTDLAIIERVVAITGMGHANTKQLAGTHGRKQTIYRWCVTASKARSVLREVYPHLVGKQHQARLALGSPSSGDEAAAAHEALKRLHQGHDAQGIDFREPESLWEAGWYLRSEIIWSRLGPNPMPESVTDRPTKAHSTVFLLSKSPRYFYDADAIRTPYQFDGRSITTVEGKDGSAQHRNGERWPGLGKAQAQAQAREPLDASRSAEELYASWDGEIRHGGANARSVWTVPTEPTPFAHFATWPQKLVARVVKAGTSEHGCCPECGAPWERVTESELVKSPKHGAGSVARGRGEGQDVNGWAGQKYPRLNRQVTTTGWRPTCANTCSNTGSLGPYPPVPCTVLDIFAGSGTTLKVARDHGRHSVGIELNEEYLRIAADRLAQQSLLTGDAA